MSLPGEIESAIQDADTTVTSDVEHDLTPFRRHVLYQIVAPMSDSPGQQLRTQLEIITIRKVLHFWEQLWPDNQLPHQALATAEAVFQGTIDVEVAERVALGMSGQLDALCAEPEKGFGETGDFDPAVTAACAVGRGAVSAIWTACGADPFEDLELNEEDTNNSLSLDPWSSDAARWASDAYAGVVSLASSSADKRLEFWKWWLQEAIPAAWDAAHQPHLLIGEEGS
jgi:hypothetical protein